MAQKVKNLPEMQDTWVWSLDWEDPLEKGMAIHYSILAWRISWTEKPGGLQSMGSQRVRHDGATNTFTTFTTKIMCQFLNSTYTWISFWSTYMLLWILSKCNSYFDFNNSFKCCITKLAAFVYENRAMLTSLGFVRITTVMTGVRHGTGLSSVFLIVPNTH